MSLPDSAARSVPPSNPPASAADVFDEAGELRDLYDYAPCGYLSMDCDGVFVRINETALHWLGYSREEVIGKARFSDLLTPEGVTRFEENFPRFMESGDVRGFEFEIVRKDRTTFHAMVDATAVRDEAGHFVRARAALVDITERKLADDRVRDSEALYHSLVENLPQQILRKDLSGRFTFANQGFCAELGCTLAEIIGRTDFDFFPAALAAKYQRDDEQIIATGQSFDTVEEHQPPGHDKMYVRVLKTAVYDGDGQIIGVQGIFWDTTARKRAEQRLACQYAVARALAESANLVEATPKILEAMGETVGWEIGALWNVDRTAQVLRCVGIWQMPILHAPAFTAQTRKSTFASGDGLPGQVWSGGKPIWLAELSRAANFPRTPFALKDGLRSAFAFPILLGEQIDGVIEFFSHEIREPNPELLKMFSAIGSQIGQFMERKRTAETLERRNAALHEANEQLKAAQFQLIQFEKAQSLSRLAAGLAHEIKNPLAILEMGRTYFADHAGDETGQVVLSEMAEALRRANSVISDVMDVAAERELDLRRQDLNVVVATALSGVEAELKQARIEVRSEFDATLGEIPFDRRKIERVLESVLRNACQAMPEGGALTVRTVRRQLTAANVARDAGNRSGVRLREGESVAVVEIADTGSGIPEDKLSAVFDAFFTSKPTGAAIGLGLTVSRKIMELHEGSLDIRNRNGGGVVVTLSLKTS